VSVPPLTGVPAAATVGEPAAADAAAAGAVAALAEGATAVGCPASTGRAVGGIVAVGWSAALVAVGAGPAPQASRIVATVAAERPIAAARRRNARRVIRP